MTTVFITGGTGYLGSRLIRRLLARGVEVHALARRGSEGKVPPGCAVATGDALNAASYRRAIPPGCVFVHLVGVAHPGPGKKEQFEQIDLVSVRQAVQAAVEAPIAQFIYVSVAQAPTRIMADYQAARARGEQLVADAFLPDNLAVTILRPWYVLGPGHWWPLLLLPLFWLARLRSDWRAKAAAFEPVWIGRMLNALEFAVLHAPEKNPRILEVQDIRRF